MRLCPEGGKIKAGLFGSVTHALFRRPPLWRIDVEMLVRIVRQQSLLAQPLCLAAYRRAQAVQPFGYLRSRICRPQGNKFAEFLVGPTGHGGTSVMAAPAPGAMPTDSCGIILAIALSPRRRRLRAARHQLRTHALQHTMCTGCNWSLDRRRLAVVRLVLQMDNRPRRDCFR